MSTARSTITIDDSRVRVTTWTFRLAGDSTGPHRHEYDYIVVPVTGGELSVTAADGERRVLAQQAGVPYRGRAGTEHTVTADSDTAVTFVEIEFKS
ncbi:MAG: hypothetical protein L0H41_04885 [Microlunatus sp.]|nr:hypothetical protein [Microlunatus sp.]MDN5769504.1 hypothetical protein [Microlunatus sp.]MDN5805429.1 hypothetical protein [Microlunatus sp.]